MWGGHGLRGHQARVVRYSGIAQPHGFTQLLDAAKSINETCDHCGGLFEYTGLDGVNTLREQAEHRVAHVQYVVNTATGSEFIVASAFSDRPLSDRWTHQAWSASSQEINRR